MTPRTIRAAASLAALAALAALAGCDIDAPLPPDLPSIDVSVDFCSDDVPIWIAYQQEGDDDWLQLAPDANGTVSFSAEHRVALAFVHLNGGDTSTEIVYTTNTMLESISGISCREETGTKVLTGSVTGHSGSQLAQVSMGFARVFRSAAQSSFTLGNLPARPLDIIATRLEVDGGEEQHATRAIIRRTQNLVSSIPALDLGGSEAFNTTATSVTVAGLASTDAAFLSNNFFSQLETSHLLTFVNAIGNGTHTVETIPSSQQAAGDYHDLFVSAQDAAADNGVRGVERYFAAPGGQQLIVGPALNPVAVTAVDDSPYLRLRAQVDGQEEYPSALIAEFDQQILFSANKWKITMTVGYVGGTPSTWDVEMPDLSGAPGWQNDWGFQDDEFSWTITAYGGRVDLLFGGAPQSNEGVQYASRFSPPPAAVATVGAPARPPRPFALRRR